MFNPALAFFYFLSLPWLSFAQNYTSAASSAPAQNVSVSATGIKINLNYQNLVATITKGKFPLELYDWEDIAEEIIKDATTEPFGRTGTAPRYDRWPVLTTDVYDIPRRPSFTIRFTLIPVPGCNARLIDKDLLEAVAGMFQQLATIEGGLDVEFRGYIDFMRNPLYFFRLINVQREVAESYKSQDTITREDVAALGKGREIILRETVKEDLLLFTGPVGALLYYTMNTAYEVDETKRNAWLVPADFPEQWTQRQDLDVLHAHPTEYAAYKANVLKPAFDSFKPRFIGKSRVVFIGHWDVDYLIPHLRDVIKDLGLWRRSFYTMDVYGQGEDPVSPGQYSINPLYPINIGSRAERRRMSGRNIPAVVPFYPWYYWDVPYTSVPWADQDYGKKVADAIRNGEGPSLSLAGGANSTTEPPQLTSRFFQRDRRQRLRPREQLQGTNATAPVPRPGTAPDDDTVDTHPAYAEDPVGFPDVASQACVVGEPVAGGGSPAT